MPFIPGLPVSERLRQFTFWHYRVVCPKCGSHYFVANYCSQQMANAPKPCPSCGQDSEAFTIEIMRFVPMEWPRVWYKPWTWHLPKQTDACWMLCRGNQMTKYCFPIPIHVSNNPTKKD